MKKTRILSFLLVFAMLCGLVCIPTTAEVNSADDWQLADGWEANPLTFTYNDYLSDWLSTPAIDKLTYTNPNVSTETADDWSVDFDIYYDDTQANPNQRMYFDVTMKSGDMYKVVVQRRYNAESIQIRNQFRYYNSDYGDSNWRNVFFTLSDATGTISAESTASTVEGSKIDIWSSALSTASIANTETAFNVGLSCVDTKFTLEITTLDGRNVYTLVDTNSVLGTKDDVVSKIVFYPETTGTDNTWDISDLTITNGTTLTAAPQDPANYTIGRGWSYSTGFELRHDNETAKGAKATYTGNTVAANEGFELQFDMNHLDLAAVDADTYPVAMTQFKLGNVDVLIRVARRYNSGIFKNYHTIEVKNPADSGWTKIQAADWYNSPEFTSYRLTIKRNANENGLTVTVKSIDEKTTMFSNSYAYNADTFNFDLSGALSNLNFYGQKEEGNWRYSNMSFKKTTDNTNWTEIKDFTTPSAWALASGWTYGHAYTLVNATRTENQYAKYELFTNKVGDFKISYAVDFLSEGVETQNNFEFKLGDNLFAVRTGRRPQSSVMKNLFMFTCNTESEIKMSDSWVDASQYGVGDNATVSITYDADTAKLVCVVNFYTGTTRTWGQTVTVTNGQYQINTSDAVANAGIVMNQTDILSGLGFEAGKPAGIYRVNDIFIDTEADVNTNGFKLVGVQDTDPAAEKINVRFVGVVDQPEDFQKIGIKVTAYLNGEKHKDFDIATTEVYKAITGSANGVNSTITAEELGGEYVYALTIKGVPASGTVTFEVTPYTVDVNDSSNVTDYATYEVVYQNGEYVSGTKAAE